MEAKKAVVIGIVLIFLSGIFSPLIQGKENMNQVPKWHIDDTWSYEGNVAYNMDETSATVDADMEIKDLSLKVEKDENGVYYLSLNGGFSGSAKIKIEDISLDVTIKLSFGKIRGGIDVQKSNMGIKDFWINITGLLTISLAPLPIPVMGEIMGTFNPEWVILDFPLYEGKEWETPSSTLIINVSEDMLKFIENLVTIIVSVFPDDVKEFVQEILSMLEDMLPIEMEVWEISMKCEREESVTVPAGTYPAFAINAEDAAMIHFAPLLANFIKGMSQESPEVDVELKSTTYSPPESPEKPSTPSGPSRIRKGKEYTYETSTTDPNGSMVQYGWDWDGDGTVDEWTSFYPSGEVVSVNHTWNERGKYEVRVKARNEYGLESKWSDPLKVRTWIAYSSHTTNFTMLFSDCLLRLLHLLYPLQK